jgi:hypothetical protein
MKYLGDFVADATVNIFFTTHDSSGGAVAPSSAFEAADIRVYKNDSATQRSSEAGYTMTSPFDSITGLHLIKIDTSDNTDAGFYATGNDYSVIISPDETVDSQTVVAGLAQFSIENRASLAAITTLSTKQDSDMVVLAADHDKTQSDIVIVDTEIAAITSNLVIIASDTVVIESDTTAIESELILVHSETTIIASDIIVATTDISSLSTKQDSDMVIIAADHDKTQSDVAEVYSDTTVIESDTTVIEAGVNIAQISGDSTAADNLELMFDGTGYTDVTAPSSRSQIDAIGAASGGSVNIEATEDNTGGAIDPSSAAFVGSVQSGTFASTESEDGTLHDIDDTTNDIDIVYGFDVGNSRSATQISFAGFCQGVTDEIKIKVYDHVGSDWEIIGTLVGQAGTSNVTLDLPLLLKHTGTGSELGKVYIRFETDSTTPSNLSVDKLLTSAVSIVSGIPNGSSITLAASETNQNFIGENWTLALGGQAISGSYFSGATVTGVSSGSTEVTFEQCKFGAATLPPGKYINCGIGVSDGTFTAASDGEYVFINCYSIVAGAGTPDFDFSGLGASTGINNRGWKGGSSYTLDSDCTLSHEVLAGGGTTITTGGADVEIRGVCRAVTVTMSAAETIQFVGITGPITLSGTTTGTVNLYGVSSNLSDSTSAATVNDNTVSSSEVNTIASDAVVITTDIASLSTKQDSDMVVLAADHDKTQSDIVIVDDFVDTEIAAITSNLVIIASDTVVIESDTTAIEAAGGGLTAAQASDLVAIESELIKVYSDTTKIESDTTAIESDVIVITTDVASLSTKQDSDMVILAADHDKTQSDIVIVDDLIDTEITAITSNLVIVASDTTAIESELILVHSETTIIASDAIVITTDIASLSTKQDSDMVLLAADHDKTQSDIVEVRSDTAAIESELIIVHSDTTAIHSDTTIIASDIVEIYSDTTILVTGQTSVTSDIAAIFTTAMTESYNADGSPPTPAQALFVIMQRLTEFAISGTTITVKKLDGTSTALTLTMDNNTNPSSSTRAT